MIGRNESARLAACLDSLASFEGPKIYVDSGSKDGSAAIARGFPVQVLELDPAFRFSAARARNEGLQALRAGHPELAFVQFIDADCTMAPGWIRGAGAAMDAEPRRAVVIGNLNERRADASVYNRLCALEWRSPAGDLSVFGALGGIMYVRISAFVSVGGFNPQVIAGEDSEFGVRVAGAGFKIAKIDTAMAAHDADIHRFSQWWRRAMRAGHAIGHRSWLNGHGPSRDCVRERRSAVLWGLVLPVAALGFAIPSRGFSLLLLGGYGLLASRVFRYRRMRGDTAAEASLYARFNVIGKLAEAMGLVRFFWNRALGRFQIIEYK